MTSMTHGRDQNGDCDDRENVDDKRSSGTGRSKWHGWRDCLALKNDSRTFWLWWTSSAHPHLIFVFFVHNFTLFTQPAVMMVETDQYDGSFKSYRIIFSFAYSQHPIVLSDESVIDRGITGMTAMYCNYDHHNDHDVQNVFKYILICQEFSFTLNLCKI